MIALHGARNQTELFLCELIEQWNRWKFCMHKSAHNVAEGWLEGLRSFATLWLAGRARIAVWLDSAKFALHQKTVSAFMSLRDRNYFMFQAFRWPSPSDLFAWAMNPRHLKINWNFPSNARQISIINDDDSAHSHFVIQQTPLFIFVHAPLPNTGNWICIEDLLHGNQKSQRNVKIVSHKDTRILSIVTSIN